MNQVQNSIHLAVAQNTVTKVVNRFGRQATYNNGGFRVGLVIGEPAQKFAAINKQAAYATEAECWGVLRAVEYAIGQGWRKVLIVANQAGFGHSRDSRNKGQFFLDLAQAKAAVAELEVEFESPEGSNPAAAVARSSDAPFLHRTVETPEFCAGVQAVVKEIQQGRPAKPVSRGFPFPIGTPVELAAPASVEPAVALIDHA
jgi:hypothetical protein